MRAKEAMIILNVSRLSLYRYITKGYIKAYKLPNGYYNFDNESIYKFNYNNERINVIYSRVSTYKQKNDLITQTNFIKNYCSNNNIVINKIYSEISSGIDFDTRKQFITLFTDIIQYKIKVVYISNKDRLTRLSFKTLEFIFNQFGTSIISISNKNDIYSNNEVLQEVMSLMHILTTQVYSHRKKHK